MKTTAALPYKHDGKIHKPHSHKHHDHDNDSSASSSETSESSAPSNQNLEDERKKHHSSNPVSRLGHNKMKTEEEELGDVLVNNEEEYDEIYTEHLKKHTTLTAHEKNIFDEHAQREHLFDDEIAEQWKL